MVIDGGCETTETGPSQNPTDRPRIPRKDRLTEDLTMAPKRWFTVLALAALIMIASPTLAPARDPLVFITAFAPGEEGGIHAYEFDTQAGKLKPLHRTAGVENPFFLALSPD